MTTPESGHTRHEQTLRGSWRPGHRAPWPIVGLGLLTAACGSAPYPEPASVPPSVFSPATTKADDPTASGAGSVSRPGDSHASELAKLCARGPEGCVDFPQASVQAESCGKAQRCAVANVGSCAAGKVIWLVQDFSEVIKYYDALGSLVALCAGNAEQGGLECTGDRPSCEPTVDRTFGRDSR
jgi:hypothetical protein